MAFFSLSCSGFSVFVVFTGVFLVESMWCEGSEQVGPVLLHPISDRMESRLLGSLLINSSNIMDMFFSPLWLICEKYAPTGSSVWPLLMFPRCPTNLSFSLIRVWPTYRWLNLFQVIAYTKFELLHAALIMHFVCNASCVMVPVLLSSWQYLQLVVWLQVW